MSNLLTSLASASSGLVAFERALNNAQNNVTNSGTPGYVRQSLVFAAQPFDGVVTAGGVRALELRSARDTFAEQGVWKQLELLGQAQTKAASLAAVEGALDISGQFGISGALTKLYQNFSSWSIDPNSSTARSNVLAAAEQVAVAFNQADAALNRTAQNSDRQLGDTISTINQIGSRLRDYNLERRKGGEPDAALEAKIYGALEELSELTDFSVLYQPDGTLSVLLGGQTPLVVGGNAYAISYQTYTPSSPAPTYANAPQLGRILNADGADITAQLTKGKLAGLLEVRNTVLPSLRGGPYQAGDLNRLAKTMADRINTLLTAGRISDGPPPVAGIALFSYDATNDTAAAFSLKVNPAMTTAQLAAIDAGPPYAANGTTLKLAALASPASAADKIDGLSYVQFYGNLAGRVGRDLLSARDVVDTQSQRLSQARALREQISGVSLDEEAVRMVEFQRAYQATTEVIRIIDELTQATLGMVR
ncbi:MAG: flagellar hook-associated protein FlgK [Acidobacteria bacterium]|nr:flagellar hook-associated protein FlgK [Acidobacteriota bacterium]